MTFTLGLLLALGATTSSVLVSTADLANMPEGIIVDARSREAFESGHIPGATNLDVNVLSEERDGVVNLLKSLDELRPHFAQAGLNPEKALVIYCALGEASDLVQATRLFWILEYTGFAQVQLLDGGLAKWKAEGRPVTSGANTVAPIPVESLESLQTRGDRYATRDDVLTARSSGKKQIVDLRSPADFSGASKSKTSARAGHITGARNRPSDLFVEGDFSTFKAPEAIRELLNADMAGKKSAVVTYCNSGRSATVGYVAYRIAGFEEVSVYDGSMADWGNQADCPMTSGDGE